MTDQAQTPQTTETPSPTDAITPDAATPINEPVQDNSTVELPSFMDQLSDEHREAPGLKKFEKGGADAIAKSYLELEAKMSSGDKLALPTGTLEEDPDGWEKVFERLGRPEGADKYTFLAEVEADPMLVPSVENWHQLGLTDTQARGVYEGFVQHTQELAGEAVKTGTAAMQKQWGSEYASRLSLADEHVNESFSEPFRLMLQKTGIASNPEFVKFAYGAAVNAREDASFRGGEGEAAPQTLQDNPYAKGTPHFNMTRQGQLERNDPQLATRYRNEAGYTGH